MKAWLRATAAVLVVAIGAPLLAQRLKTAPVDPGPRRISDAWPRGYSICYGDNPPVHTLRRPRVVGADLFWREDSLETWIGSGWMMVGRGTIVETDSLGAFDENRR